MERLYFFRLQIQGGPLSPESKDQKVLAQISSTHPDLVLSVYQGKEWVRCARVGRSVQGAYLQVMKEINAFCPEAILVGVEETAPSALPSAA